MSLLTAGSCVGIPRILSMAAAKRTTGLSQPDDQAAHVTHFTAAVYSEVEGEFVAAAVVFWHVAEAGRKGIGGLDRYGLTSGCGDGCVSQVCEGRYGPGAVATGDAVLVGRAEDGGGHGGGAGIGW